MSKKSSILYSIVLISVILIFLLRFGIDVLNPTSTNWLMSAYHDWGTHYLGWAYFKEEAWKFPLGQIDGYNYPAGTTVGYTDSIPLLAIFFKIFNFLLPKEFQYLGFWLLLSHLLLSYYAMNIFKRYTNNTLYIFLGTLLITFNPVILYRDIHPALTAHWLFVGIIFYYLNMDKYNFKKMLLKQFILIFLSALINPYLVLFCLALTTFIIIKITFINKFLSIKKALLYFSVSLLLIVIPWYCTGMISFNKEVDMEVTNSYGLYGLNLNSFLNTETFSKFLPALDKVTPHQYEGYAYLGFGFLLLTIFSLILYSFNYKKLQFSYKKAIPLIIAAILLLVFAITNSISFNDKIVFNIQIPEIIIKVGNIYRASGRFVWLFYYLLIFSSLIVLIKVEIKNSLKTILLLFICGIQFYDISPLFIKNLPKGKYKNEKISEDRWVKLTSNFEKIITYKPFQNHLLNHMDYQDLSYMALKNNLPITIGYVARETTGINKKFLDSLDIEIKNSNYTTNDIIVTTKEYLNNFSHSIYYNELEVKYLDGYYLLYSSKKEIQNKISLKKPEKDSVKNLMYSIRKSLAYREITNPITIEKGIEGNIEDNFITEDYLEINGWCFNKNNVTNKDSIFIALVNEHKKYLFNTEKKERPDLVDHFKNEKLINSGFKCRAVLKELDEGKYEVFLGIKDSLKNVIFNNTNNLSIDIKRKIIPKEIHLPLKESEEVLLNVEEILENSKKIKIKGWAALPNKDSFKNTIQLILVGTKNFSIDVNYFKREDVTQFFKNTYNKNYDNAGFMIDMEKNDIYKGEYKIGILLTDEHKNQFFKISDKKIIIK
ncbi:hypothetical protein GOQ30_15670 [Flavobacterium sp. TP390]|uniref:Glycosyltransferase RgtA/B/C/D-like domain-containing protein n=1 Tax=Flavobacterium profundi TaxID=1774945 RepID=A0A6I4IUN0_9FLAO|nr:DUF6311 domain-containing protein [Flavobacterium profundi]MVO10612.1 hypothetical protein [Flavobacterium profundi]